MRDLIYSDPHLGHGRIIAYANRPNHWWRPAETNDLSTSSPLAKVKRVAGGRGGDGSTCWYEVPDVARMEDELVMRWNEVVGREDRVHLLGDMFWWHLPASEMRRIRERLNGEILMVRGNHDVDKRTKKVLPGLLDLFGEVPRVRCVEIDGKLVLMYHYGVDSWGRSAAAQKKHANRLLSALNGRIPDLFLHGHSHSYAGVVTRPLKLKLDWPEVPAVDMSVEGWDYAPASLDQILARVDAAPKGGSIFG